MTFDRTQVKGTRTVEARVLLNLELLDEHRRLDEQLKREIVAVGDPGSLATAPAGSETAAKLRALEDQMDAERQTFTLRKIGYRAWQQLLMEHPPTQPQRRQGQQTNPETFPPAVVAACCVDPELNLEDATFLMEELDVAEWSKLFDPVLELNMGSAELPKSVGLVVFDRMRSNGSSDTAPSEASPAPSS